MLLDYFKSFKFGSYLSGRLNNEMSSNKNMKNEQ